MVSSGAAVVVSDQVVLLEVAASDEDDEEDLDLPAGESSALEAQLAPGSKWADLGDDEVVDEEGPEGELMETEVAEQTAADPDAGEVQLLAWHREMRLRTVQELWAEGLEVARKFYCFECKRKGSAHWPTYVHKLARGLDAAFAGEDGVGMEVAALFRSLVAEASASSPGGRKEKFGDG